MKFIKHFIATAMVLSVCCGLTCPSGIPGSSGYTLIEVTRRDTNEVVTDAEIIVSDIVFNAAVDTMFEFARVKPTNETGQTIIPIAAILSDFKEVELTLSIEKNGIQETVEIPNTSNSQVSGIHYVVKVLSNDSDPPPLPTIQLTLGSNPANIEIFGYIQFLAVCSNNTGVEIWTINTNESGNYYQEEITFGVLPEGFGDNTGIQTDDGIDPRPCSVPLSGLPIDGFTIYVTRPFSESVQTETYCIDEQGAVITCR